MSVYSGKSPLEYSPHIRFVSALWSHTSGGVSGIIQLFDEITNEHKFYWGVVDGRDEWADIMSLAGRGSKLPIGVVRNWLKASENPFIDNFN